MITMEEMVCLVKIIRVEGRNYVRNFKRFQLSRLLSLCSQLVIVLINQQNFASKCDDRDNDKQIKKFQISVMLIQFTF
jgi:hypothetical protein